MKRLIDLSTIGVGARNPNAFNDPERAYGWNDLLKILESAPTVDAVPVVRCRDCINYNTDNCCDGYGWCENLGIGVHDNFFCKIGERKNDG